MMDAVSSDSFFLARQYTFDVIAFKLQAREKSDVTFLICLPARKW